MTDRIGTGSKCECGKSKPRTAEQCALCCWRDGATARETRIIDALRTAVEPIDVVRVASLSDTTERSVLRSIGPLIANGRVIKTEGPPTTYKLGTKRKKPAKQTYIPGTEPKTIEAIDEAIEDFIDAGIQVASWKARREEARANIDALMIEHEKELDKDEEGARSYAFSDGQSLHSATLPKPTEIRHAKISSKRITSEPTE